MVLLALAEYDRLLSQGGGWAARAQEARHKALAEIGDRARPLPEDIILQIREERDEQLDSLR